MWRGTPCAGRLVVSYGVVPEARLPGASIGGGCSGGGDLDVRPVGTLDLEADGRAVRLPCCRPFREWAVVAEERYHPDCEAELMSAGRRYARGVGGDEDEPLVAVLKLDSL